jgi:ribosomal protein S18 acetylase RimI-like enzyme
VIVACRPALAEDLTAIAALQAAAWPNDPHKPLAPQLSYLSVAFVDGAGTAGAGTAGAGVVGYARLRFHRLRRVPHGHYLGGLVVDPAWRRHGIGTKLTAYRINQAWAADADIIYYFANSTNEASIAMHRGLGFAELKRPFDFPGVTFAGGVGVLFGLTRSAPSGPGNAQVACS